MPTQLWNNDDLNLLDAYHMYCPDATLAEAKDSFDGAFESEKDWAEETLESAYQIPESLWGYIDLDKFLRDAHYQGYVFVELSGKIWVFQP